jgi:hypothetical protein
VTCFKVLSKNLSGGTEETHEKFVQESLSPARDSKLRQFESGPGVLNALLQRSVTVKKVRG